MFEYIIMPSSGYRVQDQQELNVHGSNGWELVSVQPGLFYLKREVQ